MINRVQTISKHAAFNWAEILAFFGIAGMNIFQVVQGVSGAVMGVLACIYAYYRVRAQRAKALAYERGDMTHERRK